MTHIVNQHTEISALFAAKEAADRRFAGFHTQMLEISRRWHTDMATLLGEYGFTTEAAHHRQQLQAVEAELARGAAHV